MIKKLLVMFTFILLFCGFNQSAFAIDTYKVGGAYTYMDGGMIYSKVGLPLCAGNDVNDEVQPDLTKMRRGEATSTNVLMLVDLGDSSIDAAMRNGGITKVHYVDREIHKVFVPLIIIPIYVREHKTIVYGE